MIWFSYFLLSILVAAIGLFCGGVIGSACIRWYRISSFEGKSGYFVVGMALLGAFVCFVVALITVFPLAPTDGVGWLKALACASLIGIGLSGGIYTVCWMLADIPPEIDGQPLRLEVEIKLPIGRTLTPADRSSGNSLRLYSVVRKTGRKFEEGNLHLQHARLEEGRWIVPGSVELFTMRGSRSLIFNLGGAECMGYDIPLPARPTRIFLDWSQWGPRPKAPSPAWPETKHSYRFRVQKI